MRTKWEPESGARMGTKWEQSGNEVEQEPELGEDREQSGNKNLKVGQEWEQCGAIMCHKAVEILMKASAELSKLSPKHGATQSKQNLNCFSPKQTQ